MYYIISIEVLNHLHQGSHTPMLKARHYASPLRTRLLHHPSSTTTTSTTNPHKVQHSTQPSQPINMSEYNPPLKTLSPPPSPTKAKITISASRSDVLSSTTTARDEDASESDSGCGSFPDFKYNDGNKPKTPAVAALEESSGNTRR